MRSAFEREAANFQIEVDEEAARLVRLGVPPWDALIQARQRVSRRRRLAAQREGRDENP